MIQHAALEELARAGSPAAVAAALLSDRETASFLQGMVGYLAGAAADGHRAVTPETAAAAAALARVLDAIHAHGDPSLLTLSLIHI